MRFERLDLNLLVALNALLSTQSVSAAAEQICLSQSAMSGALNRLRDFFEDELLVPVGRRMILTPRAAGLVIPVREALHQIRTTITDEPVFDPARSCRRFTLLASDYVIRVLLTDVVREMIHLAPNMQFSIGALEDDPLTDRVERAEVDLLIVAERYLLQDHPKRCLFTDDYVVVAWKDNRAFDQVIDLETYAKVGHVSVSHGRWRYPTFEDWFARTQSIERRVEVVVPGFSDMAHFILGTDRIATMHRRLALLMSRWLPLKIAPVPFEIPSVRIAAQWHSLFNTDPALLWFIDRLSAHEPAVPA